MLIKKTYENKKSPLLTKEGNNKRENVKLVTIILICSIRALVNWNPFFENKLAQYSEEISFTLFFKQHSSVFLSEYLLNKELNLTIRKIIFPLIQTLNIIAEKDNNESIVPYEQLKQYLRKFSFFYRYYYLKAYPNDLSTISTKKINRLAIKALFYLYSI